MHPAERLGDEIDASLFEDTDGPVYFLWHSGKIAKLKPDTTGFAEPYRWLRTAAADPAPWHHSDLCARIFAAGSFDHVGCEGMFLFRRGRPCYLFCSDSIDGRWSCCVARATSPYGPISARYEAIPHGGHNAIFRDVRVRWWSTYFGKPWDERPAILPLRFDKVGHMPTGKGLAAAEVAH